MIDKNDLLIIDISRKYRLRPDNTIKCRAFILFDQGYNASEVKFLLKYRENAHDNPKAFARTIRRYYYEWKKAQNTPG